MNRPKLAASLQTRLLTQARVENREYTQFLTRYGLRRFLYRLSISCHADRFVLNGALLFDRSESALQAADCHLTSIFPKQPACRNISNDWAGQQHPGDPSSPDRIKLRRDED